MTYFSNILREESFHSTENSLTTCNVQLWCEGTATDFEYNVRTSYNKVELNGTKYVFSEVKTVESHYSMKNALRTYNEELLSLGDPDYEAHKASN